MPTMTAPVDRTAEATARRERCEAEILQLLKRLCVETGLDLEAVTVRTLAAPAGDGDGPQVVPFAVKITLAV